MFIKFDVVLVDYKGDVIKSDLDKDIPKDKRPDLTLEDVCISALLYGNKELGAKLKRFDLTEKIYHEKSLDLPIDDLKLLKDLVEDGWSPGIVGPALRLLEGKTNGNPDKS